MSFEFSILHKGLKKTQHHNSSFIYLIHRLKKLMVWEPENEKIYFNLGMLTMDEHKFEEARQWFDKAIQVVK